MVSKKFQIFVRLVYFAGIRRSTIFGWTSNAHNKD
jgi:hypothetical protein